VKRKRTEINKIRNEKTDIIKDNEIQRSLGYTLKPDIKISLGRNAYLS
jgi:hypothetical protein